MPGPSATSHRPRLIRVHRVGQTANVDDDRHGATIAALLYRGAVGMVGIFAARKSVRRDIPRT